MLRARDGGCLWPGCDRPPWQTEAHHIRHWHAHGGKTDVADGVLLCRFHHLTLHSNHWEIARGEHGFELIPPTERDPRRRPIPMPAKSAAWERIRDGLDQRRIGHVPRDGQRYRGTATIATESTHV